MTFPPNGKERSIISCRDLSSVSTHWRLVMAASSQIIKDALRSSSAMPLCFVKLYMLSSLILIGILNLECAMRSPGNIDAAIPDVAVAIAINPLDWTIASSALYIESGGLSQAVVNWFVHLDNPSFLACFPKSRVCDTSHCSQILKWCCTSYMIQ